MALSKAGFRNERNICGLHTQLLELTGFSEHEIEEDELLDFYVTTLDRLTEENLLETTENIHEVALTFYETLTAKRDTTGK